MSTITAPKQKEIDYYDRPEISHSKLKKLQVSYNEFLKPFDSISEPMIMGSLMDEAVLEPELYATREESKLKTVTSKGFLEEYKEKGLIIPNGKKDKIDNAVKIVKNHPLYYLLEGDVQTEIYETLNGEPCKSKLDVLNLDRSRIIDFKTTSKDLSDITPYYWVRNWFYHTQLAFYRQMVSKAYGINAECYLFVYSWSNEDVRVFQLSEDTLSEADRIIDGWFDKLANVKIDGAFKGMSAEVEII
jgi:hypothetical protein